MTIEPSVVAKSNLLINLDASLYALRADNVHEGEPHECTHRNAEQKPFHASVVSHAVGLLFRAVRARATLARRSPAVLVQTKAFGLALCWSMYS